MFSLIETDFQDLRTRRRAYLKTLQTPVDGMWEDAFFATGRHWTIQHNDLAVGYLGVNADNALLGFECSDGGLATGAFTHCLEACAVTRAFASTAEPAYLSQCLDHQTGVTLNALMYQDSDIGAQPGHFPDGATYRLVSLADFDLALAFGIEAIGADRDWLAGYYGERIQQQELFGLWMGESLVAAGELRISPSQTGVADVGMVVAPDYRRQGIATEILRQLRHDGRERGLRLVCSTEVDNHGAQRAIAAAGFQSAHRLLEIAMG